MYQFKLADTRFAGFYKYCYIELSVNVDLVEANEATTLQILTHATSVLNFGRYFLTPSKRLCFN